MKRLIALWGSFYVSSALVAALLLSAAGVSVAGEHQAPRFEIGPFGGIMDLDVARHLNSNLYGGRLGINFSPYVGLEAVVGAGKATSPDPSISSETIWLSNLDVVVHPVRWIVDPYVSGGVGAVTSAVVVSDLETQNQLNFDFGGGLNFWLADRLALRCDYHGYWARADEPTSTGNDYYRDMIGTVGLSVGLGSAQPPLPDSDQDGVSDDFDRCSETPLGMRVDSFGCPPDADQDGVADVDDTCAGTPAGARVDTSGCPKDSDGDGMADGIDTCPNTPKKAEIDSQGCPIDSDRDGVFDGIDRCNGTALGVSVDQNGCPLAVPGPAPVKTVERWLVLHNITFKTGSAQLLASSFAPLDEVAASLNANPSIRVEVGGYADAIGSEASNLALTQRRADAVRNFLISRGVDSSRLSARGYGEADPISTNETAEGRAMNRRVELHRVQ
jgi:OOP family OmpA-OmpF porin